MKNASNQKDGKAVDNVVSDHEKTVDNVVSNLLQPEIDTQILNSFMKVDPVFNQAGMDVDFEVNTLYPLDKVYYSFDEAEDDTHNYYPLKFLNSRNVSRFPPHHLRLKIGCPIIILRNLDLANGLCNGTRLICKRFEPNVVNAEIVVGQHAVVIVLLPRIPLAPYVEDMFPFKPKRTQFPDALINEIFPSFGTNTHLSVDRVSRAILSTKNEHVDNINDMLIDRFPGEDKVYYSFDEAEDDTHNYYPLKFLNSRNVSRFPPHHLRLKIGCPIIILRNLDLANGLCNGTRLICKRFEPNVINTEIVVGQHAGVIVLLPRISLAPYEEDMFPFKPKRTQFPVRLSFAMTINKA
nr:hypothetical protein [Tanacetum cinerariifolium]